MDWDILFIIEQALGRAGFSKKHWQTSCICMPILAVETLGRQLMAAMAHPRAFRPIHREKCFQALNDRRYFRFRDQGRPASKPSGRWHCGVMITGN